MIFNYTVSFGVDSEVTAHKSANARALSHTDLAHDNLASLNFLTTKKFNAKALTGTIVDVFGCTTSLNMTHNLSRLMLC